MITTVLAFILTLGILIIVHEYGHYRVAVACGVKVLRFSVGFGRVLWRKQATPQSTEFVLSALPFGGYVKMLDEREGAVLPAERHRAFNRQPLRKRAAIVLAGPLANLLLAVLLYAAANWIGMEEPQAIISTPPAASIAEKAGLHAGDWIRATSDEGSDWQELRSMTDLHWQATQSVLEGRRLYLRVSDARGHNERSVVLDLDTLKASEVNAQLMRRIGFGAPFGEPVMGDVKAGGAAARAGVREGDRVLSVDGRPIGDAAQLRELIRGSATVPAPAPSVPTAAASNAVEPSADTTPAAAVDAARSTAPTDAATPTTTSDARPQAAGRPGTTARVMAWRVERAGQVLNIDVQPAVVDDNGSRIGRIEAFIGAPAQMVTVRYGLFEGFARGAQRTWDMSTLTLKMFGKMLIGEASLKNLSGPLTIADYAGQSVRIGLAYYLGFLAVVSVSLGVLNLLPLPMLDGGHLMYYVFEAVTGRPVSERWLERLQRGGMAIMLMMMSLALYNDVARIIGQH